MIQIGKINTLVALRETSVGVFLGDDEDNDILLPNKYVPDTLRVDDPIDVFVYTDSEDRIIATTLTPKIQRNQFARLQVVSVTSVGAFLDWGLEKDLLVPYREQSRPMEVGRWYVVYLYLDHETDRLVASSRLNRFLDSEVPNLTEGQEVSLLAWEPTDLGINVIINNRYRGLVYANEVFRQVYPGDRLTGYVKTIREDNRIDVSLQKPGYENVEPNAQRILATLKDQKGFLPLNDYSEPEEIYKSLEMSKKTFKKAIGALFRERKIVIKEDGIYLA
ncbi:S1-like domain-containing RNA-binding protein [Larkinella knui]|uniref:GntR family transcriptional regulator n=1 Tax=Larkinella knui TaxID=2025310 RepID=A0A3P1CNQ8_9BACT|nr:S1-like domain-containing RNA-binding protein [Larkinella knui]RRB14848.1 GntR family transcriptional regulator [Larkinella knui]